MDNWQIYVSAAEDDVRVKEVPPGLEVYLGEHPEASVKTLANIWTRYTFQNASIKDLWVGAGANYVGPKAQRVNNPKLYLPDYTLYNAAVGYDWKWSSLKMSGVINWQNISNEEYFPSNQQRGLPARVLATITASF
jgi:iron complex outermembrane receptor protein